MFNILMPPNQEELVEKHYGGICSWNTGSIVRTCITELLHGLMDIQYMPSKELATIYFANNGIERMMEKTVREVESIEMVKTFPQQLNKAFCLAYADKLILASRAISRVLTDTPHRLMITKQLKQVVSYNYLKPADLAVMQEDSRQLWMEFQIDINSTNEDQTPKSYYYFNYEDPRLENVIRCDIKMSDIKLSLVSLEKSLRTSKLLRESLPHLKTACMHLLMIASSLKYNNNPHALTQTNFSEICRYIMDGSIDDWGVWSKPEDIDLAQVVMTRHLSRAARCVAKFEKPTGNIVIQNLLSWFAIETYIVASEIRESRDHGSTLSDSPIAANY